MQQTMIAAPSGPIPESAERRAAMTQEIMAATGLNDAILERLVRAFYETAREDEIIGFLFVGVQDGESISRKSPRSGRRSR
jgi:hypothetical protein